MMSLAQDPPKTPVRIRVGKEPLAPGMPRVFWVASRPPDVKWAEAEVLSVLRDLEPSRLQPVEAGTAEGSALKASVAAFAELVPPPGESAGLFTMRRETGDVLVSRHEHAWLWSGPWYQKLIYDIDPTLFDDADAMVRFMDGLFPWTGFQECGIVGFGGSSGAQRGDEGY